MGSCIDHGKAGSRGGYATCWWQGQYTSEHRKAYCEANDCSLSAITGKVVRHTCDNSRCVNHDHLVIGSQQDNMDDMAMRGRANRTGWHFVDHSQINYCRGEAKPNAVWTEARVLECRSLWATGEYKQTELAAMYGCRQTDISRIVNRKAWVHV